MSTEKNTNTKYSVPDDHWEENNDEESAGDAEDVGDRAQARKQTVEVLYQAERRQQYRVHISHGEHRWEPIATYGERHRWKGNYFSKVEDVDWPDLPMQVREQVAAVVAGVSTPSELDPEFRIIDPDVDEDEGGDDGA